jgi:gliding motility-associated-like protein
LTDKDGIFYNTAVLEGVSTSDGSKIADTSTNGLNPDPFVTGDVTPKDPTPATLIKNPLFIPHGFSPNNDGIHDLFTIENANGRQILLEVFNRWGNRIYRSKDYQNNWNGKTTEGIHVGDEVPVGTYYYVVVVDNKEKYVGYITINR